MHSEVRNILTALSSVAFEAKDNGDIPGDHCEISLTINNNPVSRIFAFKAYEILRKKGLVRGMEKPMTLSEIQVQPHVRFSKDAGLSCIENDPEHILFHLNFSNQTPAQLREGIEGILSKEDLSAAATIRKKQLSHCFTALARAAGITPDSITVNDDDIVIMSKGADPQRDEKWKMFNQSLFEAHLLNATDVRSFPLLVTNEDNSQGLSISIPDKDFLKIKSALFDAEVAIRMANSRSWNDKAGDSSFVPGTTRAH